MKRREPSEFELHCSVADLLRYGARRECIWLHIPNGEKRDPILGAKLKRMGEIPGAPDFLIITQDGVFCLELKAKNGKQSPEQKAFELRCEQIGVPYEIARSFGEAQAVLSAWRALRVAPVARAA